MAWRYTIGRILPQDDGVVAVPTQAGQRLAWDLETTKRIVIDAEAADGATTVPIALIVDFRARLTTITVRGQAPPVMEVYATLARHFARLGGMEAVERALLATAAPVGQVVTAATTDPAHTAGLFHRLRERSPFA